MLTHFRPIRWLFMFLLTLSLATGAHAQLNEHCTVSVLNRTVQVKPDGSWVLPNIPANFGQVRARATCVENGITRSGQSEFFTVPANGAVNLPTVQLGAVAAIPASLTLAAPKTTLTTAGETAQVTVTAKYPNGSTKDVSTTGAGTNYTNSNAKVATVTPNGLVTAVSSGTVIISALNEGALGLIRIQVTLSGGDSDGDGIPDDIEIANGLNPNDPTDGFADPDNDGLTNREELMVYSTNPRVADTDGDGLSDGDEVRKYGTNPVLADSDGDGANDGREVQCGSDPQNKSDRGRKLVSIEVKPPVFTIHANTVLLTEAYWQLNVTGHLANNCGTVDLTSKAQGTNYTTSDQFTCNFGAEDGRVFAAADGSCAITATNSGFSATAHGTVTTFAPTALTFINIPGTTNNVDVNGNFAYVAAGSAGLHVVDVSNHSAPVIAGAVDTPGNANDVVVIGSTAFVADGPKGLQLIDLTDPHKPLLRSAVDTPGDAQDVVVKGTLAFVADGPNGLQVIDVSNLDVPVILGVVDTPGAGWGVDATPDGLTAVVADGTSGIQIVDTKDPKHPAIIGTLAGGDARDVAVRGNFAVVADLSRSFTSVDLSDPGHPVLKASTDPSLGGRLLDVALAGRFAVGADIFFVNDVPIIDVSTPAAPQPRALLPFRSFGDDNGTGIAADSSFVYLTTDRNRLFIGQYLAAEDRNGIPPTARLTAPTPGSTFVEGETIPVTVEASDDIAVGAVNLLANGSVVASDTTVPYQFNFTVPVGVSSLTFSAAAVDLGNNVGFADPVAVSVIPDPLTTVIGTVVDPNGNLVVGATVTTTDGRSGVTASNGSFSLAGVKTILGPIQVKATFTTPAGAVLTGASAAVPAVRGGITDVGQIRLASCLPPPPGLVSWWPGDGNFNDVMDGNTGANAGGTTFTTGKVGQAFNFNGAATSFVTVGSTNMLPSSNQLTIDAWIKPDFSQANAHDTILTKRDGCGGDGISYNLNVAKGGSGANVGEVLFTISPAPTLDASARSGSTVVPNDGQFHHVAGTYDGTVMKVYLDGVLVGQKARSGPLPVTTSPAAVISHHGGTCGQRAAAAIDEVEFFNRALSQSEIQDIFTAGSAGKCKPEVLEFQPQQRFAVGAFPSFVAVADVNGDSRLDVITSNASNVAVFLGNGDGTFQPQQRFAVGVAPGSVAVADVNGDGRLDVVTANEGSGDVSVLLGNGNGTFQAQQRFAVGVAPTSVAVADVNGDGRLDVVTATVISIDVAVLLGNGNGTFQGAQRFAAGMRAYSGGSSRCKWR